jgi:tetratricopeptide (TPR) repeat protein
MKVPFALFAEYAVAKPDGAFYIVAGGADAMECDEFPHRLDRLSLAVKVIVEPAERLIPSFITIRFVGPNGEAFAPFTDITITPQPVASHSESVAVNFVYNLMSVVLPRPGEYVATVNLQDAELARASFRARGKGTQTVAASGISEYQAAFTAFQSGEVERAEALFRQLVARVPAWSLAQNALGFVLLTRGDASAALDRFMDAKRLEAGNPELLDVNVACCYYVLRDYQKALSDLEYCLRTYTLSSLSLLLAIHADRLVPTTLSTAGDYVALLALNAGWSALRAHDYTVARTYLTLCRASIDVEGAPRQLTESLDDAIDLLPQDDRQGPQTN